METLENRVETLESRVARLEDRVTTLEHEMTVLRKDVIAIQTRLNDIDETLHATYDQVGRLSVAMTELRMEVNQLRSGDLYLAGRLGVHDMEIELLKARH